MPQRGDHLAPRQRRGIDEAEQIDGEARVVLELLFDVARLGLVHGQRQQPQQRKFCRFGALRSEDFRMREVIALEQRDTEIACLAKLLGCFHLLGEQRHAVFAEELDDHRDQHLVQLLEIDLDDVDRWQQAVKVIEVADEIIDRHAVIALAQLAHPGDRALVRDRRLEEFQHDARCRQRLDQVAEQKIGVDVDEAVDAAYHLVEANFSEGIGDHGGRREHVVAFVGDVAFGGAEQQLETDQLLVDVDDRLAGEIDGVVGHGASRLKQR